MKPSRSLILFLFAVIACSRPGNQESTTADTLAVTDTAVTAPVTNEPVGGDTSQLSMYYASKVEGLREQATNFYEVTVQTSQYEATSNVTWHFDDGFSPRHFQQSWAAEGNEGSIELFVEDGNVVCATEDDGMQTIRWCKATGGTRTQFTGEGENTSTELLPDTFDAESNERLTGFLNTLRQILKDGEVNNKEENIYTIHIEHESGEGPEFTTTVEVMIPKAVYDELMK